MQTIDERDLARGDTVTTLQLGGFLLASAGIICVARASLRQPRSHGF